MLIINISIYAQRKHSDSSPLLCTNISSGHDDNRRQPTGGSLAVRRIDEPNDPKFHEDVLHALLPMFDEDAAQMPKKGFPDAKHFGFKDSYFYPFLTERVVGGNALDTTTIFVSDVSILKLP